MPSDATDRCAVSWSIACVAGYVCTFIQASAGDGIYAASRGRTIGCHVFVTRIGRVTACTFADWFSS